ncbi:MAG: metallophosphoesterase, partial [Clostridia bacterium]|nr:metallophosphoesterase [Clostridia bacterium]
RYDAKEYNESEAIVDSALASVGENAQKEGTKYLLLPGDLTRSSEYEAHVQLAKKLEAFEKEYGIQVIVTNGNHDINVIGAATFENNVEEPARSITAAEFKEVYKNLGFDLASEVFMPQTENGHGMLSYVADIGDDYGLIVVDSSKYDPVNVGKDPTSGYISAEQMEWILEKGAQIRSEGKVPFVMIHHNLAAHMECEPSITHAFVLDDYIEAAETLADNGINFSFSGHLHTNDIANVVSDYGNVLYDCETPSLTGFPNQYRNVTISTDSNNKTTCTYSNVDCDDVMPVSVDGVMYPLGEFKYTSFGLCFGAALSDTGHADLTEMLLGFLIKYVGLYGEDIKATGGGVVEWLKMKYGLDIRQIIESFLEPYIGSGIGLGGYEIFSADNIVWFVEDLLDQIVYKYIDNPENLAEKLRPALKKILEIKVSDYPCTKFYETLGFGDPEKPGTLEDAVLSAVYYWYTGNENIDDDIFIQDTLKQFDSGDLPYRMFDVLVDVAYNDILNNTILSEFEIRLDKLFGTSPIGLKLGEGVNKVLNVLLRGDFTYKNLVDTVFELGVLPYTDILDAVNQLVVDEYLTPSQIESVGHTLSVLLSDFATESVPVKLGDMDISYSDDKLVPEATKSNFRLPTMVSVTMGDDSKTSAYINWFSKESLPDTDIEIYEYDGSNVEFTGKATETAPFTITKTEKVVDRVFPGIDFGVAGVLNYHFDMYQHTVSLTNLKPDTKYVFKDGNESFGWWSGEGSVETSGDSTSVTFFHMSDPQSQNEAQYARSWANTVDKAFSMYPDAKFIANTGDLVDHGMNNKQWQWMFDTASDNLMKTYLMPATGNHEEFDDYSTVSNFVLPNVPEQETASGVYYSYTYNNVHVAVLNTNDLGEDHALSADQIDWLKEDMNSSDAQWKIVAFHKAVYSNGSHYDDKDVCAMRDQFSTLLPELDIDLVLQGHDHVYLRTHSLDGNEVVVEKKTALEYDGQVYDTYVNPTGTSYVIDACSGVKVYQTKDVTQTDQLFPRAAKTVDVDTQVFSAVQIVDGVLYFNAYKVSGDETECIDKFAIQKDGSGTETDKTPDIMPDTVVTPAKNTLGKILSIVKKVLTVMWNIFRMYVIEYAWQK